MLTARATFALGLTASLAVHAVLFFALPRYAGRPGSKLAPRVATTQYALAVPDAPEPVPSEKFGEKGGIGAAVNSSAGDLLQSAPESRADQAALSRDPTGQSSSAAAQQPPPKPLDQVVATPPPAALPTPPPSPLPAFRKPEQPSPPAPAEQSKPPTPPVPPAPPSAPASPAGGRPEPPSDRDSDLFAREQSAEYKAGRVVARSGREFKFTRPRVNLSSMVQAAEIQFPATIKFHLRVNPDGRVRSADVTRSTGSPSIDRAFQLAMYESWFEPKRNARGEAIADETDFTMTIE